VHDLAGVIRNLMWQSGLCVLVMVLRYFEFGALLVRWDSNAYGSVAWAVLAAHTFVAVTDVLDTIGLTLMFKRVPPEEKHFVDVTENSLFWYFVVAMWIPLFILAFLTPYV
jgi:heme/copper-type cytochrome/quinol oxidase subunit 3